MITKENDYGKDVNNEGSVISSKYERAFCDYCEYGQVFCDYGKYESGSCDYNGIRASGGERNIGRQMDIGYRGSLEHSIIMSGGGRVGRGEWDPFAWFFRSTVMYRLLLRSSCREDVERAEDSAPLCLTEVVGYVIHELNGRWNPAVGVERFTGGNEIS